MTGLMTTLPEQKPIPDLTDVGLADVVAAELRERDVVWIVDKSRWARLRSIAVHDWLAKEQVEAVALAALRALYERSLEAAWSQWSARERERTLKRATRLRSVSIVSTVLRLAKTDRRVQRSLDWLAWDGSKGSRAEREAL